jgi:hypothetical protein
VGLLLLCAGCLLPLAFGLAGCQSPERAAVQPLPPNAGPLTYPDLVNRAKAQVAAGQEFFFRDSWTDVEQAADALRQTGELLGKLKPEDVPANKRDMLAKQVKELTDAAGALREAGQAKDARAATQAFQRLHLVVRELRPD